MPTKKILTIIIFFLFIAVVVVAGAYFYVADQVEKPRESAGSYGNFVI